MTTIGVDFVSKPIMSLCLIVHGRKTHIKRTIANCEEINDIFVNRSSLFQALSGNK